MRGEAPNRQLLLSVIGLDRLRRIASKMFDESEFLSPYGLRAISAYHRNHPYILEVEGLRAEIDYEPAESTTGMFGGNSNWRGPIWFPLNYLLVSVLERYRRFLGADFTFEYPTGSGKQLSLDDVIQDLSDRLISIFLVGPDGRRPCFGWVDRLQQDRIGRTTWSSMNISMVTMGQGSARHIRLAGQALWLISSAAATGRCSQRGMCCGQLTLLWRPPDTTARAQAASLHVPGVTPTDRWTHRLSLTEAPRVAATIAWGTTLR
jgi:hypothetical protein